jgi:uncharacterized protein YjbJ (UPF0337 family)
VFVTSSLATSWRLGDTIRAADSCERLANEAARRPGSFRRRFEGSRRSALRVDSEHSRMQAADPDVGFRLVAAWHSASPHPTLEVTMALKDDVTGKAKEAEGKLTDDKSREAEGKLDQAKGKAKDAAEDVKDAAKS